MITQRHLMIWVAAAAGASALLTGVLIWQHKYAQTRWSIFLVGDPRTGARLFFHEKGCAQCHSVNGEGGKRAPDLGSARQPESSLNQLVTAMWNHAPFMWERMRREKIAYPDLNNEETAHLFAFLYASRYMDEPGDPANGGRLFRDKGCSRCHGADPVGGRVGPDIGQWRGVDTPIRWMQTMWNHAPAMESRAERLHLPWPRFQGREMNDLLAYIRVKTTARSREMEFLPADPGRGWKVFQAKSCIACHAVKGKGGRIGPELGPNRWLPLTIVQFAGLMWNHSPEMWRVPQAKSVQRPTFEGQEIADLVAFLCSLRYFEPAGSPHIGQTVFAERGCGYCHGPLAEGARAGPPLRGRGQPNTVITLATSLWRHGPRMYQRTVELKRPWPTLAESDVGELVAFLNSSTIN